MLLAVLLAMLGVGIVLLGAKGFSADGIPLTYDCHLNGAKGRCVGMLCLLVGSPLVLLAVVILLANGSG